MHAYPNRLLCVACPPTHSLTAASPTRFDRASRALCARSGINLVLSGSLNHKKKDYKFGCGLTIGGA